MTVGDSGIFGGAIMMRLLDWWHRSRHFCAVCHLVPAVLEISDTPVCRSCWNKAEALRRFMAAADSSTADEEIAKYYRRFPPRA